MYSILVTWGIFTVAQVLRVLVLQVYLCGNSTAAKQAVADISTKLGFTVLDRGSLSVARELEDFPLQLFPEWRLPIRLTIGLTASFFFYLLVRDVVYAYVEQGKDVSFRIMVSLANKVNTNRSFQFNTFFCKPQSFRCAVFKSKLNCVCLLLFIIPGLYFPGVSHCVAHHAVSLLSAWSHSCLPAALQRNQIQVRNKYVQILNVCKPVHNIKP